MPTATISSEKQQRLALQAKRVRMARAAMGISQEQFAKLISNVAGVDVSREIVRKIELGGRDIYHAELRAMAQIVGPYITDETETPLGWLAGGGEPVFVNPGYLKDRWHQFVIPWDDGEPAALAEAS